MAGTSISRSILCRLDELADPGSRGLTVLLGDVLQDIFLVRKGAQVYGYLNRCPHTGSPLDWQPDQFLSLDKSHIQCATHAARFRIEDGRCVAGPCQGDLLTAIPVMVEAGDVFVIAGRQRPRNF
jgi:nitrite reductase/ring-hydroxylating ferredoxin subunit